MALSDAKPVKHTKHLKTQRWNVQAYSLHKNNIGTDTV